MRQDTATNMTGTLCELRVAIEGNNVQRVAEIQDSLRPLPLIREKYFNCDCMVVDELATLLIPSGFYIPDDSFYHVKTLGNGNCLFNSVSFFIKGNYTLSATLRTLTSAELFLNAKCYTQEHQKFRYALDWPETQFS